MKTVIHMDKEAHKEPLVKVLFIGGSKDGQRIDIHPGMTSWRSCEYGQVPKGKKGKGWKPEDGPIPVLSEESYRRMTLHGNTRPFDVMVLEGMTADDVMARLIEGYKAG